eukprot:4474994-Lingulodinium_polyedra.AAC.1
MAEGDWTFAASRAPRTASSCWEPRRTEAGPRGRSWARATRRSGLRSAPVQRPTWPRPRLAWPGLGSSHARS